MPTSNWTRLVIVLATAIALGIVWVTSGNLDPMYAKAVVTATSAVTLFLLAFDVGCGGTPRCAGRSEGPSFTVLGR